MSEHEDLHDFKGIKVGDEVALWFRSDPNPKVVTVTKVTPSGRMQIKGQEHTTYDAHGREMGDRRQRNWYPYTSLTRLTPEFRERAEHAAYANYASRVEWKAMPTTLLREVYKLVKAHEATLAKSEQTGNRNEQK